MRIQPEKPVYRNTLSTDADAEPEQSFPKDHRRTKCNLLGTEFHQTVIFGDKMQLEAAQGSFASCSSNLTTNLQKSNVLLSSTDSPQSKSFHVQIAFDSF